MMTGGSRLLLQMNPRKVILVDWISQTGCTIAQAARRRGILGTSPPTSKTSLRFAVSGVSLPTRSGSFTNREDQLLAERLKALAEVWPSDLQKRLLRVCRKSFAAPL
jgi:hypothetical protein